MLDGGKTFFGLCRCVLSGSSLTLLLLSPCIEYEEFHSSRVGCFRMLSSVPVLILFTSIEIASVSSVWRKKQASRNNGLRLTWMIRCGVNSIWLHMFFLLRCHGANNPMGRTMCLLIYFFFILLCSFCLFNFHRSAIGNDCSS